MFIGNLPENFYFACTSEVRNIFLEDLAHYVNFIGDCSWRIWGKEEDAVKHIVINSNGTYQILVDISHLFNEASRENENYATFKINKMSNEGRLLHQILGIKDKALVSIISKTNHCNIEVPFEEEDVFCSVVSGDGNNVLILTRRNFVILDNPLVS